ncbi:MAG: serine hydrolase domain-containing protein [Candidatus Latescibacterota bacterium]
MKTGNAFRFMLPLMTVCILATTGAFGQAANTGAGTAATAGNDLDAFFKNTIARQKYVGLGACLVRGGKIVWQGCYGYADLEEKKPVQTDTIFQLASLSKVVTTTALMQLYEKGLFGLDDDVNKYLPFTVRNPNFPDTPITFRMLMTHTASFADLLPAGNKFGSLFKVSVWGDSPIPLGEFTEQIFTPGAKFYSPELFSTVNAPGTKYEYSNIAFSLIGCLVEKISGEDFSEFCKKNIFQPLEMRDTGWHLRDLDVKRITFCYMLAPSDTVSYRKVNHFGLPGYPEGMLRTTMHDFTNYITALMNNGAFKGRRILKPETVELMLSPQNVKNIPSRSFPVIDIGLTWLINDVEGEQLCSMNGFSGSIHTNAYFSREKKTGMIYFFTGINMQNMPAMVGIVKRMHQEVNKTNI